MSASAKLAAFATLLALLFGGGALAGDVIAPGRQAVTASHDAAEREAGVHPSRSEERPEMSTSTPTTHGAEPASEKANPVHGLAVAQDGLRVVVEEPELRRGRAEQLAFRIVDRHGETVRDFDVEHEKRMHLILVRRDLTGFQHLHPEQRADGTWTTTVRLDQAGTYRLFADFSHDDTARTLASDLHVDGRADLRPLGAPQPTGVSDGGYDVRLDAGDARPGRQAELRFSITKAGAPVRTEPYLGAGGHLVALRDGDLAYLHVHPTEHGHGDEKAAEHGDAVGFAATFPTEGRYQLFFQFQHKGRVHTVAFTRDVTER